MTGLEAIFLGIIQGIFMFFPVSSTSHLVLAQHWLLRRGSFLPVPESPEMIAFDLLVHVGTLLSIALVFRKSLISLIRNALHDMNMVREKRKTLQEALHLRLIALGFVSVLVTGVVGYPLRPFFEQGFAHPAMIAGTLSITGILLWKTDTLNPRVKGLRDLGMVMALIIGLAQAMALMPGISRSGITIVVALFLGLRRRWAAEYSFFIAIPTILAASLVKALEIWQSGMSVHLSALPVFLAFLSAALTGIFTLTVVLHLLYRAKFRFFSYYVWALALVILFMRVLT